jgi:hypothetical protein
MKMMSSTRNHVDEWVTILKRCLRKIIEIKAPLSLRYAHRWGSLCFCVLLVGLALTSTFPDTQGHLDSLRFMGYRYNLE